MRDLRDVARHRLTVTLALLTLAAASGCYIPGYGPISVGGGPPDPVTVSGLLQGEAGEFSLEEVPRPEGSLIKISTGRISYTIRRGADFDVLCSDAGPLASIRWVCAQEPAGTRVHERPLLGVVVSFRGSLDTQQALADLAADGVVPAAAHAVLGLGGVRGASISPRGVPPDPNGDPPATLIVATSRPDTWLGFAGGRLTLMLVARAPGFWERQPGWVTPQEYARLLDELPRLSVDAGLLTTVTAAALQDTSPSPLAASALRAPLADLAPRARAALDGHGAASQAAFEELRAHWTARWASASLVDSIALLVEQARRVPSLRDGAGHARPAATAWADESRAAWMDRLSIELLDTLATSRVAGTLQRDARFALPALARPDAAAQADALARRVAWTQAYSRLRDADPLLQAQARFALLRRTDLDHDEVNIPAVDGACVDLSEALRELSQDDTQDAFVRAWAGGLGNLLWFCVEAPTRHASASVIEAMFTVAAEVRRPRTTWPDELASLRVLAPLFASLSDSGNAAVYRPAQRLPFDCARRLRELLPRLADPIERALATGLARCFEREQTLDALPHVDAVTDLARAFRDDGTLDTRIDRIDALAARRLDLGPLAEELARQLGHPAARELARAADAVVGQPARKAMLLFDAATLGAGECPEGMDSRDLHMSVSLSVGSLDAQVDTSAERERARWLRDARLLALSAVGRSLPRVSTDDPARALMNRYLGRQLGGELELARRLGIRLIGLNDVQGFDDEPPRRLRLVDGEPRWVLDASTGDAVELSSYHVDEAGWTRLASLADELVETRSDLGSAKLALRSDLPSLEAELAALDPQIVALQAQVGSGGLQPAEAERRIAALRQESRSLGLAISNYNSRTAHLNAVVVEFNARVGEYNALLFELNAQLSSSFSALTEPATDAAVDEWLARAPLTPDEKQTRRWLLGRDVPSPLRVTRPASAADVGQAVRFATDPVRAATVFMAAFDERRTDTRLHSGETPTTRVLALFKAVLTYLDSYGEQAFVEHLLHGPLAADQHLEDELLGELKRLGIDDRHDALAQLLGR